jgi:hypothetical protein
MLQPSPARAKVGSCSGIRRGGRGIGGGAVHPCEGPCIDAVRTQLPVELPDLDLAPVTQWAAFTQRANPPPPVEPDLRPAYGEPAFVDVGVVPHRPFQVPRPNRGSWLLDAAVAEARRPDGGIWSAGNNRPRFSMQPHGCVPALGLGLSARVGIRRDFLGRSRHARRIRFLPPPRHRRHCVTRFRHPQDEVFATGLGG